MISRSIVITAFAILTTVVAATVETAGADPPASGTTPVVESSPSPDPVSGTRRLLILCGHPGDEDHRAQFVETVDQLRETLTSRYGFDPGAVTVLFGAPEMLTDGGPAPLNAQGACTQEAVAEVTTELSATLQPDDALWVVVMGHSHFDGLHSHFNLAGPDIDEEAFARSFEGLACRELVFWITIPASGFYIRPLAADGRVIITATEADREINETTFPHVFADVLAEPTPESEAEPKPENEWDADADGRSTLFDLYINVIRRIAQAYLDENTLSTEHARLEDNGDGRGSEVQRGYLSEELGGRLGEGESPRPRTGVEDGALASTIPFELPIVADEPAETEPADAAPVDADSDDPSPADSDPVDAAS